MPTTKKSLLKTAVDSKYDMYAGQYSKIKGEKIVLTIDVEDKGQDVTYFVVEFYLDYALGYVLNSGNYQNKVWRGQCILSGKPKKGAYLLFSEAPGKEVRRFKYKITNIQEWPLQLYHLHTLNYDYDDYSDAVVAAYSEQDAKTISYGMYPIDEGDSTHRFLTDKDLKIDLLSDTLAETVKRGKVCASFHAG